MPPSARRTSTRVLPLDVARHRRRDRRRMSRMIEGLVVVATVAAVVAILSPIRTKMGLETPSATAASAPPAASVLTGMVRVIDGDTLDLEGARVRLHGIDAFEQDQTCGPQACGRIATQALAAQIEGRHVACEVRDVDRYGRSVAVCRSDGRDVNGWIVAEGHAVAYRRYSADYLAEETAARRAGRGGWSGGFDEPEAWRRAN